MAGAGGFPRAGQVVLPWRDAEIRHLERLVEREPITLLYGVAGHGKTSLLQAGLFPRLRDKDYCPVYIRLDHCEDAPELAAQVRTAIAEERHIKQRPGLDRASLWEDFHHVDAEFWGARNRLLTPILVFDQFEEIFTLGRSSAAARGRSEAFLAELADLVEGRPPQAFLDRLEDDPDLGRAYAFDRRLYKVLLSLREEYLADIEALRSYFPPMSYNRFRLCRMDGANAKAAVVGAGGDLIEANVAEELVRFVAAEAESESTELGRLEVEPAFLSVVCRELNNKRPPGKKITLDLLQGNREEILTEFYRRSLKGMPPELRTFIEDGLLTVDGFRDSEDWHNALEEPGVEAADLQELVRRRLLRIEETRHRRRIELIHDLLIDVVADSRDRRRREQRLAAERRQQEEELERRRQELDRVRRFFIAGALVALIFIAIGAINWLDMARIVRGQTLSLKEREFVAAARLTGVSTSNIIFRHIAPNLIGVVVVYLTLAIPQAILVESFLSYLGLGIQEPGTSLGSLVRNGVDYMETAPWVLLIPGGLLAAVLLAFNFLGDGLRDVLDARTGA